MTKAGSPRLERMPQECDAHALDSREGYHQFHLEPPSPYDKQGLDYAKNMPKTYGSFEVFWDDSDNSYGHDRNYDSDGNPVTPGWYWWACFPGCLPDSEPSGPFESSAAACLDADEWHPDNG